MKCEIRWNVLSLPEWDARFKTIRRANLLQSYDYGCAIAAVNGQRPRWGLIMIDGVEAGLVQIMEAGLLGNAVHAVIMDLGPLWFPGFGDVSHINAFMAEFNRQFPRRFGRRRRIIPNAEDFDETGFKKLADASYETVWIDLTEGPEVIKAAMKPAWRNKLKKAEKAGLTIKWDEEVKTLPWLLTKYKADRAKKGYSGPSVRLLLQMAKTFGSNGRMMIGRAHKGQEALDNDAIAAILILCHGSSATYQIGWSNEDGRQAAAHNLLLWQASCLLSDRHFTDLDLGGINDENAKGVSKFKEGMFKDGGGQKVRYAGHYL